MPRTYASVVAGETTLTTPWIAVAAAACRTDCAWASNQMHRDPRHERLRWRGVLSDVDAPQSREVRAPATRFVVPLVGRTGQLAAERTDPLPARPQLVRSSTSDSSRVLSGFAASMVRIAAGSPGVGTHAIVTCAIALTKCLAPWRRPTRAMACILSGRRLKPGISIWRRSPSPTEASAGDLYLLVSARRELSEPYRVIIEDTSERSSIVIVQALATTGPCWCLGRFPSDESSPTFHIAFPRSCKRQRIRGAQLAPTSVARRQHIACRLSSGTPLPV